MPGVPGVPEFKPGCLCGHSIPKADCHWVACLGNDHPLPTYPSYKTLKRRSLQKRLYSLVKFGKGPIPPEILTFFGKRRIPPDTSLIPGPGMATSARGTGKKLLLVLRSLLPVHPLSIVVGTQARNGPSHCVTRFTCGLPTGCSRRMLLWCPTALLLR